MSLKVVKSIVVAPAMLDSSVPVNDHPEWLVGQAYAAGQRVVHAYQVWESLADANTGHAPEVSGTWWVLVGVVNRLKAFDLSHTTKTRFSGNAWFEVTLESSINALALLECDGLRKVRVVMTHPSYGLLYDKSYDMWSVPVASNWYDWTYAERREQDSLYMFDLPSYRGALVRIEIDAGSSAGVGVILLGQQRDIGVSVSPGMTMGIRDYSRKEVNQWGDVTLQKRAFSRERALKVVCEKEQLDNIDRTLSDLRATPVLWLLSMQYRQANVYGWFSDYKLMVDYGTYCVLSLQLEGFV